MNYFLNKDQKKMSESKPEEDSNQNPRVTWEGCSVLLDINDGDRLVFARLTPGSRLTLGNKECSLQPLIGCPFGLLFQAENGEKGLYLSRVLPTAEGGNLQEKRETNETKDNRALVDNNTAQNLTGEDIDALRRQGASGDEIVEALIANSATYENKTSFSQEKYRLKKQKKYAPKVLLRRPFARSICETYFKKYPDRIGFLRVDSLSVLLSMANVTANSDVLVVDKIGGILTGAVAERLGGTGYVCNTYRGVTPPSIDIVRIFNFSTEICKRIVQSPLQDLCSAQKESEQIQDANNIKSQTDEEMLSPSASPPQVFVSNEETMDKDTTTKTSTTCKKAAKAGQKASPEAIKLWRDNGFSSLVIAAPDIVDGADLWSFAKEVIPLLSFSAPFAIYHQCEQPLIKCMRELQQNKMAINLQLSEPWLREYQVLPSRTHPLMQMSGSGGYILSGTRIATDSN